MMKMIDKTDTDCIHYLQDQSLFILLCTLLQRLMQRRTLLKKNDQVDGHQKSFFNESKLHDFDNDLINEDGKIKDVFSPIPDRVFF